jgi:pilus assembly protein FimV
VLRKMVDLDPDNVAARDKLADLCAREGATAEALEEFTRVAEILKKQGRHDDFLRVGERIMQLSPDNVSLARELAEQYLQRGDQKRALAKLQICFRANPRDIDTLRLLASAFSGLGQTAKTVSVYKELAHALTDKGERAEADKVWAQLGALDPQDADFVARNTAAAQPQAPIRNSPSGVTRRPPSAVQAAPKPAVNEPPKPENLSKLLTETEVYVKYGLYDKALDHLRKVFAVEPENLDAHEKAYAIYVAANNPQQASEQLLNVLRLHTRQGDALRAKPYLETMLKNNPNHAEVPAFVAALGGGIPGLSSEPEDTLEPAVIEEESTGDEKSEPAAYADPDDETLVVADDDDEILSSEIIVSQESGAFLDIGSSESNAYPLSADSPIPDEPTAVSSQSSQSFTLSEEDEPVIFNTDSPEPIELGAEDAIDTNGGEVAAPVTQPSLTQTAPLYRYSPSTDQPFDTGEEPTRLSTRSGVSSSFLSGSSPADEECDEAVFFIEQGLYEEAQEVLETVLLAYPDNARAAQLLASLQPAADGEQMDSGEESTSPFASTVSENRNSSFDLATELADELVEFEDAPPEPAFADDYQVSVEEVLSEFKKGLEKVVKPEDVDTHYDLGIAYKEMGLLDDALSEFEVARKGCPGKPKELDCLAMVSMIQSMRGNSEGAISALVEALKLSQLQADTEKGLRYDLAQRLEEAGKLGKALGQFLRVQTLDPRYRDVEHQVSRLSAARVSPESLEGPQTAPTGVAAAGRNAAQKGRKVGFI